jgi:hypothetical protein
MRRLLIPVVILALGLSPAAADPAVAGPRVPANVRQIAVTLTFPPQAGGTRRPVRRTLTAAANVRRVIQAADALEAAPTHIMCPMIVFLGPQLTVAFKAGRTGSTLAEAQVEVTLGTRGSSGESGCFPIRFFARGSHEALVGNSFVRLIGRLIGIAIS